MTRRIAHFFFLLALALPAPAAEVYKYEVSPGICGATARLAMEPGWRIQLVAGDTLGTSATSIDRLTPVFLKVGGLPDTPTSVTLKARYAPLDGSAETTETELGVVVTRDVLTLLLPQESPGTLAAFRVIMSEVIDRYLEEPQRSALKGEFVGRLIQFKSELLARQQKEELDRLQREAAQRGIIQ